jgi:hypothetical protein
VRGSRPARGRRPRTRRFTVVVSPGEDARLRAFDNATQGRTQWPLGPNRGFLRKDDTTFVVQDWTSMGVAKALVTTDATARLTEHGRVEVVVRSRAAWLGWLFIAIGLMCVALVGRDGIGALLLGAAFLAFGWWWSLSPSWRQADLDEVEAVMRSEIDGDWQPAPR